MKLKTRTTNLFIFLAKQGTKLCYYLKGKTIKFFKSFRDRHKKNYRRKIIGKVLIIFWVLILPAYSSLYLFGNPLEKIPLDCHENESINITEKIDAEISNRSNIADIIQIPLELKYYKIYITNKSSFTAMENEQKKKASIVVLFREGNPKEIDTSLEGISEGFLELISPPNEWQIPRSYEIAHGETEYFVYPGDKNFLINLWGGSLSLPQHDLQSCPGLNCIKFECEVYAKPYMLTWISKVMLVFIFFLFSGASFITIFKYIRE